MASPCILIIEDDDTLRDLVVEAMEDIQYTALAASDGHQALRMIETHADIDVIFSDVSMPNGLSGIDLAQAMRVRRPDTRFILASGYAKSQLPPIPEGVSFLPKPYRIVQLLALLESTPAH